MDVELPGLLANYQLDETFVAVTRQAFLDANTGVDGATISRGRERVRHGVRGRGGGDGVRPAAQLTAPRSTVTVDVPVAAGTPQTSGFVADPVCTATGHFLEVEDDFTMPARLDVLRWPRTYSSRFVAGGPFGRGWASWASVALRRPRRRHGRLPGPRRADGRVRAVAGARRAGGAYARVAGVAARLVRRTGDGTPRRVGAAVGPPLGPPRRSVGVRRRRPAALGRRARPWARSTFAYTGGLLTAWPTRAAGGCDLDWDGAARRRGRAPRAAASPATATTTPATWSAPSGCWATGRYAPTATAASSRCGTPTACACAATPTTARAGCCARCRRSGARSCSPITPATATVVSDTDGGPVAIYEHDRPGGWSGLVDDRGHRLRRRFDARGRVSPSRRVRRRDATARRSRPTARVADAHQPATAGASVDLRRRTGRVVGPRGRGRPPSWRFDYDGRRACCRAAVRAAAAGRSGVEWRDGLRRRR